MGKFHPHRNTPTVELRGCFGRSPITYVWSVKHARSVKSKRTGIDRISSCLDGSLLIPPSLISDNLPTLWTSHNKMNTQPYRESLPSINEAIPGFLNWSCPQKTPRQPALQLQLSQTQQPPSSQTTHCQPSISTCPRSTLQTTHGPHISYTNPRYKVAEEDDEYGQHHRHKLICNPLRYQAQASSELAYPLEVSRKGENQELDILSHTDWAEVST